jgi:thioredoxin-like negative regulator of GroEL
MKMLATQTEFEALLGIAQVTGGPPPPAVVVIYFTASWCGACSRLDLPSLEAAFSPGVTFLKCDVDVNDYTAGYCGIRKIPTFLMVKNKKPTSPFSSSDTAAVAGWIKENL